MKETQRTYPPGSEWTYIKIYAGNKTMEKILVEDMPFIISKTKRNLLIDKWFFIRYADPDFHLRIRFLSKDRQNNTGKIIEAVNDRLSKLVKGNLVWKIQIDTYNRELERYGNELIEEAEYIFFVDSECILSILKKLNNNEEYRWMIALKLIDNLLSDFSFGLERKQMLLEQLNKSYKAEFGFNEYNAKQFNVMFRDNKQIIESVLNNKMDGANFIELCEPIKKRSKKLKQVIVQLGNKIENNNGGKQIESLLSSYIHMMINRLFMTKNRIHELVLYDFMYRYYTSEIARQKYNPNK